MNTPIPPASPEIVPGIPPDDFGTDNERQVLTVVYVLHAVALVNGITAIIAVIISHLRVNETRSAFIRSHHLWLIRSFWWALLWSILCGALVWAGIGLLGLAVLAIWWIYRVVRGLMAYSRRESMPV